MGIRFVIELVKTMISPYIKYNTILGKSTERNSTMMRMTHLLLAFRFCFMSRMICIIFVWFVSRQTTRQSRFISFVLCPSIAFHIDIHGAMSRLIQNLKKKKGLGSLSSVTFHPVLFLPLASNPSDGALTHSVDSFGHVPSS